jgi:hypothetical protein
MFAELMQMIQQQGQQAVVNNPEVPNEQNEAVMQEASSSIMSGMTQMFQQGGPGALKTLFDGVQSGDNNNPAVQQLSSGFAGNIMEKFGISGAAASSIAASLIPVVLGKLMNRAKDPNDSGFDISSILGSLTGGGNPAAAAAGGAPAGGGDMMSTLSSLGANFGLDKNGDGKTDLSDLMKMFS